MAATTGTIIQVGSAGGLSASSPSASVLNLHMASNILGISAGTTQTHLGKVVFSNSNGVSFGINGLTVTGSHNGLTTAMASNRGSDFVQATAAFAGTNASGTIASNGISVSVNAGGGDAIRGIAANGSTASTNTVNFSNANGLSFGFGAAGNSTVLTASHNALTTAMASNRGSDFVQANAAFAGTNASGTIASNGISVSVAAPGAGGGIAIYDGANSITSGTARFTNANGVSFSFNGQTVSASVNTSYRASNDAIGLNTAGTNVTWTANSAGLSLNAGGYAGTGTSATNASITMNTNGLAISVAAPGAGGGATVSFWQNMEAGSAAFPRTTLNVTGAERVFMFSPLEADFGPFKGNMTVSTMMMPMNLSGSTATMSAAYTTSFSFGFYTNNAGTLSLVNSASTSFGSAGAATNNSTLFAGSRFLTLGTGAWSSSPVFSAGVQYWWAYAFQSAGRLNQTFSAFGQNIWASNSTFAGVIGAASAANNTTKGIAPFYGNYTITSNAVPATVGSNQLNKQVATAVFVPHLIFNNVHNLS